MCAAGPPKATVPQLQEKSRQLTKLATAFSRLGLVGQPNNLLQNPLPELNCKPLPQPYSIANMLSVRLLTGRAPPPGCGTVGAVEV